MARVVPDDFEQYVLNQSTRLLRTAYLLTGDRGCAEDLVQDSLVATYRHLSHIRDVRALDAYVRTTMGHTLVSWTRRPVWRRERPASEEIARMTIPVAGSWTDRLDRCRLACSGDTTDGAVRRIHQFRSAR